MANGKTVTYTSNRAELIALLGGAVHAVGGPPARVRQGDRAASVCFSLVELPVIVARALDTVEDWTVESPTMAAVDDAPPLVADTPLSPAEQDE